MAEAVDRAAASADQGGRDAALLQERDDAIDGVALGNATEIELDLRNVEPDGARRRIEDDVPVADVALAPASSSPRDPAVAQEEPPRLHQWSHRDVERAVSITAVVDRARDQVEELAVTTTGPPAASRLSCERGLCGL